MNFLKQNFQIFEMYDGEDDADYLVLRVLCFDIKLWRLKNTK